MPLELLIDTNRYVDMIRGVPDVSARFDQASRLYVPFVVLAELLAGFAQGANRRSNEAKLRRFLNKPSTEILLPDESTPQFYAQVALDLKQQGRPIPTNDMWVAAQALQHGLALDTRDVHFPQVPGLTLV